MFGRSVGDPASCPWELRDAEVSDSEQLATARRKTARHTKTPKDTVLLALKDLSWLLTTTEPPLLTAGSFSNANMATQNLNGGLNELIFSESFCLFGSSRPARSAGTCAAGRPRVYPPSRRRLRDCSDRPVMCA